MIHAIDHFNITASDPQATLRFYVDLLGLSEGWRPPFGFPGAWLYAGERAILHLVFGREPPPAAAGVIDHVALNASGLAATRARFDAAGWPYEIRRLPGERGGWQMFCHDPDGARIELGFAEE